MDNELSREPSSYWTQADALLRKNLTYQKRQAKTNCLLISFPFVLCVLLVLAQRLINAQIDKPSNKCGCKSVDTNGDGKPEKVCGPQYSTPDQVGTCASPSPPQWPAFLQIPKPEYRAVKNDEASFSDFPDPSCRLTNSCPASVLVTASNQTLGKILEANLFSGRKPVTSSNLLISLADMALGSSTDTPVTFYLEPTFTERSPLYDVVDDCTSNRLSSISYQESGLSFTTSLTCVQGLTMWRNSSSEINTELYKGYRKGNPGKMINEMLGAYDFLDSSENKFNVHVWYNSTYKDNSGGPFKLLRVPRTVNLATNAFLSHLRGPGTKVLFEFFKEFPKPETTLRLDFASLLGPLFFSWIVLLLFPVTVTALVYEKQQKLRIMMKMHGLGDGPYWLISYAYFFLISCLYILVFVVFGSLIGLKFFVLNDYGIQLVFYFIYLNLQIALAFLVSALFTNVKTVTVTSYIGVFATGLLGSALFQAFLEDPSFPRSWIVVLELYPGFSLYRGLYEFSQYSFTGNLMGTRGMTWESLRDSQNGMPQIFIIMFVEFFVVLCLAFYVDQYTSSVSGRSPPYFLTKCWKKTPVSFRNPSFNRQGSSKVVVDMERPDVIQEMEKIEQLLLESNTSHAIICDNIRKVYPGRDGNPPKVAVRGLSLALARGECFGMLGPNGAGKTSFISMMIGLTKPSSGSAYVEGLDILTDMNRIYSSMGVCPQHDLLWDSLTGREHLLFYGRLKNLKGSALKQAVQESLRSVNLLAGGAADKQSRKYSGGMKRRLSVAISLIGNPKVVYMDEPSTGLDPASRSNLWSVVKEAKRNRAIILTTHSMEEAEVLCDRIGIFVDGGLQCIGNPKELKARYGGSYVLTMTTAVEVEAAVESMVKRLSPDAQRVYQTSGTQKFEMPKHQVRISDVFRAVEVAKGQFPVFAWGISDTTLEDVFIKVATESTRV